mmetsp:Transcript_87399/g.280305  ORF Transcript_87399/g.280305 Transcript_87399/m.280305 type:complete len:241 (-) Transcript_87399:1305-2027(-)
MLADALVQLPPRRHIHLPRPTLDGFQPRVDGVVNRHDIIWLSVALASTRLHSIHQLRRHPQCRGLGAQGRLQPRQARERIGEELGRVPGALVNPGQLANHREQPVVPMLQGDERPKEHRHVLTIEVARPAACLIGDGVHHLGGVGAGSGEGPSCVREVLRVEVLDGPDCCSGEEVEDPALGRQQGGVGPRDHGDVLRIHLFALQGHRISYHFQQWHGSVEHCCERPSDHREVRCRVLGHA